MTDTRYLVVTSYPPYSQTVWAEGIADAISKAAEMIDLSDTDTSVTFMVQDYPETAAAGEVAYSSSTATHRAEKP